MQNKSTACLNMASDMIRSGIAPLRTMYRGIYSASDGRLCAFDSGLYLSTSGLGTLSPDDYGYAASKSDRCTELFVRSLEIVCDEIPRLMSEGFVPDYITVFLPVYVLEHTDVYDTVKDIFERKSFENKQMICLCTDEGALYSDLSKLKYTLLDLGRLGVKTAICGIGHEKSPVTSLTDLPYTYIFLHDSVSALALSAATCDRLTSLVHYLQSSGSCVVATQVSAPGQRVALLGAGCQAYTEACGRLRDAAELSSVVGEVSVYA